MKIYTKLVLQWNKEAEQYDRIEEESYDYDGPLTLCGGGGDYSPPAPPDPTKTAAAQSGQDRATAQTNALLLNPNINSPYGTISYDTQGYTVDPSPNATFVQRPTQTITLSDAQQQLYNAINQGQQYAENAGVNWASQLPGHSVNVDMSHIPSNIDFSGVSKVGNMQDYQNQANQASKAYYDQAYSLMQPQMDLTMQKLQDQVVNSGNPIGSEDYNKQMQLYQQNQNSALQNLANQSIGQGYNIQNQLFTAGNQTMQNQIAMAQLPYQTANTIANNQFGLQSSQQDQLLNGLSALLRGQQAISLPQGAGYSQTALQSPNIAGMTMQNYQNQLNGYNMAYQMNNANSNSMMNGLFGIGSSVLGGLF